MVISIFLKPTKKTINGTEPRGAARLECGPLLLKKLSAIVIFLVSPLTSDSSLFTILHFL